MNQPAPKPPGFWQVVLSTLAAAFGVQSRKNLETDFKRGNIYVYIIAGLLFTLVFIGVVLLVVRMVLAASGL